MTTKAKSTQTDTLPPKGTPAAFVTPTLELVEDYEPETVSRPGSGAGRVREANPFDDVVTALLATWDAEAKRTKAAFKVLYKSTGVESVDKAEGDRIKRKIKGAIDFYNRNAKKADKDAETVGPRYVPKPVVTRLKKDGGNQEAFMLYLSTEVKRPRKPETAEAK